MSSLSTVSKQNQGSLSPAIAPVYTASPLSLNTTNQQDMSATSQGLRDGRGSSASICGKRSRSNSSSSYLSDSATSDVPSSSQSFRVFLSDSDSAAEDSPASSTSVSPPSHSECEGERTCPSPATEKRKTIRCERNSTACTAPRPTSVSVEKEVASLDGAVKAIGLDTQAPIATASKPSSTACPSASSQREAVVDHLVGKYRSVSMTSPSTLRHSGSLFPCIPIPSSYSDAAVATVDAIWSSPLALPSDFSPNPSAPCTAVSSISTPVFVRETLRRSRTSCSTLQAALLYCLRIAPAVRAARLKHACLPVGTSWYTHLLCRRRIFLAAIMAASKFLQDRNYSNKAWVRISGLPLQELSSVEREFLAAIRWDLNVRPDEWQSWTRKLSQAKLSPSKPTCSAVATSSTSADRSETPTQQCGSVRTAISSVSPTNTSSTNGSSTPTCDSVRRTNQTRRSSLVASAQTTATSVAPHARLSLLRSHSDDAPFASFDASLTPTGSASAKTCSGPPAQSGVSSAASGPHAYPKPRQFVRSSVSFSASSIGGSRPEILRGTGNSDS